MAWITTLGDARQIGQELIAVCHNPACRLRQLVDLDQVIEHVGAKHGLMPVRGQPHFSERMRCPRCRHRGMFIWIYEPKAPGPLLELLGNEVRVWGHAGGFDVAARAGSVTVAHRAFEAVAAEHPTRRVTLQAGWHLIRDSRWTVIEGGKG